MNETLSLRFLYHTKFGRVVLKVLVNPFVSKIGGKFLDSKFSRCVVSGYIKKHNIDMTGIVIPKNGFKSFNDFFTRRMKEIPVKYNKEELVSPCDGFLTCVPIRKHTVFDVKHTKFTVDSLLRDKELAKDFENGMALIFRLEPSNYHRYMYPVDGQITKIKKIKGILHTVRPIATKNVPVFVQNAREYQVINTEKFGKIVQMEVGALMVGKISNHAYFTEGSMVWTGDEKGYFEFGGSTIILLLQKGKVDIEEKWLKCKVSAGENPIKIGEKVGTLSLT